MAIARVALMGAGLIGREHATLLENHPAAELAGIADPAPSAGEFADRIGTPYFADYERLLDETKPDACIVAVPNDLHLAAGMACISRRLPCLIEKPIAGTLAAAKELVQASESSGVPVLIGHHRRQSPDIRAARRAVGDGTLGGLVAVSGMWLADKPDTYFEAEWRRQPGAGPLLINLTHDIDCLRFIVGEIDSVQAFTSNAVREFQVPDTASIALRFENGVLGTFLMSDAVASPYTWDSASGQALYFPHQPEDCYYFGGRKASLAVPSMHLWRHESETQHWQDPFQRLTIDLEETSAYANQLDHFLCVVARRQEPVIDAREGMMTLAAALAVERAAQEGRTVTIAEMLG